MYMGFGMFSLFQIIFLVLFFIAFFLIFGRSIKEWTKNNNSPRLTVPARAVAKRQSVSHHDHVGNDGMTNHHTSTSYYVTFEVESGDRMELHVTGSEYGMIAEGDYGKLSFQGTRYLSFERAR